jgi:hypothetical protein
MATRKQQTTPGTHFKVLLDLGPIKVVRWTLMPGACTPRYPHPCPFIVMPETSGILKRIVSRDGKQIEQRHKLVQGQPYFRKVGKKGIEQSICNVGDAPVIFAKIIFCPCGEDWDDFVKRIAR